MVRVLIIAFGIVAFIDIWLIRQVKRLTACFNILTKQCQNNTAMIFLLLNILDIPEQDVSKAIKDFNKQVEEFPLD